MLLPILQERLMTQTAAHWSEIFFKVGVPVAPIQSLDQLMQHPQVIANDMIVHAADDDGTPVPYVGMPFKIKGVEGTAQRAAPRQNRDALAVLRGPLAFSDADIAAFVSAGAVVAGDASA